jgi:hypothetical protein
MLLAIRTVLEKQTTNAMQLHTNQPMTTRICGAFDILSSAETVYHGFRHLVPQISKFKVKLPTYLNVPDVKLPFLPGKHL